MALKSESSLSIGLASGVLVYGLFQMAAPTIVDGRAHKANDPDYDAAIKLASWTSAAAVSGIALLAKDPTVFIIGGTTVIAMTWWHKHANMVDPLIGKASAAAGLANKNDITQAESPQDFGYPDDALPVGG